MSRLRSGAVIALLSVLVALAGCAGGKNAVDNQRAAEANASLGADFLRKQGEPDYNTDILEEPDEGGTGSAIMDAMHQKLAYRSQ